MAGDHTGPPPLHRDPGTLAAAFLCLAYGLYAGWLLPDLDYNYDEGIYIHQARLILAGKLPYVDFFYHQTPLFPFTLAAFGAPAPDQLFAYRLPSLLGTVVCAFTIFVVARRLVSTPAALVGVLIFLSPPLQFFGLVALPNSLMLCLSTLGVALTFFSDRRGRNVAGAVLLVVSVLYKPLSISAVIAVGVTLLVVREHRHKVLPVGVAGLVSAALSWALLHLATEGAFTEVLSLQLSRYTGRGGWEIMSSFAPFHQVMEQNGLASPVEWNRYEHIRTFILGGLGNPNLYALALGLAGQALLLTPLCAHLRGSRLLVSLWWLAPFALSLYVWEPNWDHYYIQYLPPLAVLGAVAVQKLLDVPGARSLTAPVALALAMLLAAGPIFLLQRVNDYWERDVAETRGQVWLTFDPFINFLTGTEPACGAYDPFNVYAEKSLTGDSEIELLTRHHVGFEDLVTCLENDPDIKIGIGYWGRWFVDERLQAFLDDLPCGRMVPIRHRYVF